MDLTKVLTPGPVDAAMAAVADALTSGDRSALAVALTDLESAALAAGIPADQVTAYVAGLGKEG